jgi:hypothetical protein
LAVGEIIDRSASFWRANWRALFALFIGFQLSQYALAKALELLLRRSLREALHGASFDPVLWLRHPPDLDAGPLAVILGAAAVFTFVTVCVAQLAGVAASAYMYPRIANGPPLTISQSLRCAITRLPASLGAVVLSFGMAGLMAVALFSPSGVAIGLAIWRNEPTWLIAALPLALTACVGLVLWYVLRFILTAQVAAIEPLTAWGIIRRTGALASGRVGPGFTGWVKGRLTILVTIVFGVLFVVSTLTGLPAIMLQLVYGSALDPTRDVVPVYFLVPAELLQVFASALLDPLSVVFQVVFYVDMRVRREGLDLEMALTKV